jgi:replicative DNA helicase
VVVFDKWDWAHSEIARALEGVARVLKSLVIDRHLKMAKILQEE